MVRDEIQGVHLPSMLERTLHARTRIHERTISLRFLVKISRLLRLEVSVWSS
jgi:hypothetical protein